SGGSGGPTTPAGSGGRSPARCWPARPAPPGTARSGSRPCLRPDGGNPEADVVGPPLRLEPQPEGRPARPAVVAPGTAPANPRVVAGPVLRPLHRRQVRVVAARQLRVVPVPAPLVDVAVHVVQAPGVGRVAADLRRPLQRRPRLGPVVRLALEVRLLAAELVAERRCRGGDGSAGVLPLGLRRQPGRPPCRQPARLAGQLGQLLTEPLGLGEVHLDDRVVVPLAGRLLAGELADPPPPLALGDLVLARPEALRQPDLDLRFVRPPLQLVGRAAHRELPRRAPAELHTGDLPLLPGLGAEEGGWIGVRGDARAGDQPDDHWETRPETAVSARHGSTFVGWVKPAGAGADPQPAPRWWVGAALDPPYKTLTAPCGTAARAAPAAPAAPSSRRSPSGPAARTRPSRRTSRRRRRAASRWPTARGPP